MSMWSTVLLVVVLATVPVGGQHAGTTIRVMCVSFMKDLFERRIAGFEAETGAKVILDSNWASFPLMLEEVEAQGSAGFGHDAYIFTSTAMPDFAEKGYLADLTNLVEEDEKLEWQDVFPFFRRNNVGYSNRVFALPYDGDFLALVYRKDLVPNPPTTIEELVTMAAALNGKDMNGDGIPDAGWCECMGPTEDAMVSYLIGDYLVEFIAPYLQSKGTSQGAFFDASTLKPLVRSEGFRRGLKLLLNMYRTGTSKDHWKCNVIRDARDRFLNGSCAFGTFWHSSHMIMAHGAKNSWILDRMAISPFPGAQEVSDENGNLRKCDDKHICPHANVTSQGLVNYAPFAAYGGFVGSVNSRSRNIRATYDFLAYCNRPEFMVNEVVMDGGLEPFRRSQMDGAKWKASIPYPDVVDSFLNTSWAMMGSDNILVDLRIPGAVQFISEAGKTVEGLVVGHLSFDAALLDLERRWETVIEKNGGVERLLPLYRLSLNLPRNAVQPSSWTLEAWYVILVIVAAGVLLAIAGVAVGKAVSNYRLYQRQYGSNAIAERCAMAIADMNFEQVEYLRDLKNPNNTQQAFVQIVEQLKLYKAYMPQSLFVKDQVTSDSNEDREVDVLTPSYGSASSREALQTGGRVAAMMKSGPSRRMASIVTIEVPSFRTGHSMEIADLQSLVLSQASLTGKRNNAVLVYTSGDMTVLGLNTVAHCSMHPTRACHTALGMKMGLMEIGAHRLKDVGVAVTSGSVLVANCGSDETIRAFSVFGLPIERGREASRIGISFPFITPMCDSPSREATIGHINMRAAAWLTDEFSMGSQHPTHLVIYALDGVVDLVSREEWMYTFQKESKDPICDIIVRVLHGNLISKEAFDEQFPRDTEDNVRMATRALILDALDRTGRNLI
eukprot:Sspe_Gene.108630::Locus_87753_Transcript_1_1_Confidence_1.000_Length_2721::g.108630::m.108630